MLILAAGFVLSLIGSLPPGIISLTVSQTSIHRGLRAAWFVAAGAAFAEFFQAWIAVVFTDWFMQHPVAEKGFQWAAMPVFFVLGIHLLFFAKAPEVKNTTVLPSLRNQFRKGLLISVFNLLAVPYWFVYCGWLRVEGWWQEGAIYTLIFAFGVSLGTLSALGLYAWLGQLILRRSAAMAQYANRFIGILFIGLGLKVLWGLMH
ncbi:MAG: LysE family transporter [Chitinophagales bacterium]|nr:LysE family transporter [Chitinophagales bacterium]